MKRSRSTHSNRSTGSNKEVKRSRSSQSTNSGPSGPSTRPSLSTLSSISIGSRVSSATSQDRLQLMQDHPMYFEMYGNVDPSRRMRMTRRMAQALNSAIGSPDGAGPSSAPDGDGLEGTSRDYAEPLFQMSSSSDEDTESHPTTHTTTSSSGDSRNPRLPRKFTGDNHNGNDLARDANERDFA